jgi:hypothetical protein
MSRTRPQRQRCGETVCKGGVVARCVARVACNAPDRKSPELQVQRTGPLRFKRPLKLDKRIRLSSETGASRAGYGCKLGHPFLCMPIMASLIPKCKESGVAVRRFIVYTRNSYLRISKLTILSKQLCLSLLCVRCSVLFSLGGLPIRQQFDTCLRSRQRATARWHC